MACARRPADDGTRTRGHRPTQPLPTPHRPRPPPALTAPRAGHDRTSAHPTVRERHGFLHGLARQGVERDHLRLRAASVGHSKRDHCDRHDEQRQLRDVPPPHP
jgi:hypothetical protein